MTTKYTDAPRTRVMTPAALNNGVHENHSIGQTMAIAPKKGLFDDISIPQIIAGAAAAATSVALASKIGIAGSAIGDAVSSVTTVVSSQVYRLFIPASAEATKGMPAAIDYTACAYEPGQTDVMQERRELQRLHALLVRLEDPELDVERTTELLLQRRVHALEQRQELLVERGRPVRGVDPEPQVERLHRAALRRNRRARDEGARKQATDDQAG